MLPRSADDVSPLLSLPEIALATADAEAESMFLKNCMLLRRGEALFAAEEVAVTVALAELLLLLGLLRVDRTFFSLDDERSSEKIGASSNETSALFPLLATAFAVVAVLFVVDVD